MDALRLIEACYGEAADDASWGSALATVLSSLLGDWTDGVMCTTYRVDAGAGLQPLSISGDARCAALVARVERRARTGPAHGPLGLAAEVNRSPERHRFLRATYGAASPTVAALTELARPHQEPLRQHLPWPEGDMLCMFGSLDDGFGVKLGTASPSWQVPSARRRAQLVRLSEHLAVGYWLRRQRAGAPASAPAEVVAVFAPEGRQLDRAPSTGDRTLQERLVDAVRGMDRARCTQRKHAPDEATALWQAFVGGRYALVETFERGGRRVVLAVRCRSPRPELSAREAAVAHAAARGLPNKLIGDELGISASTVGVHLSTALRKLGCPSRRLLSAWLNPNARARNRYD
jgi:two-component system, NarL family, nitrate/nitrite response regulator NarL